MASSLPVICITCRGRWRPLSQLFVFTCRGRWRPLSQLFVFTCRGRWRPLSQLFVFTCRGRWRPLSQLFVFVNGQFSVEGAEGVECERLHFALAGQHNDRCEELHLLPYLLNAVLAVGNTAGQDDGFGLAP